jgi:hypothetical protein
MVTLSQHKIIFFSASQKKENYAVLEKKIIYLILRPY